MTLMKLFFDDEGVISRRSWWIGTGTLLCVFTALGWISGRVLIVPELAEAAMIFVSIAILIPFHAINTKRFRAIGRSPSLALWGGIVPAVSVLVDAFLAWPAVDILMGWMIMAVLIWFVIDLGLYAHESHASRDRIDAVVGQA